MLTKVMNFAYYGREPFHNNHLLFSFMLGTMSSVMNKLSKQILEISKVEIRVAGK